MRSRSLVDGAGIVGVALILGWVLSQATTRVVNWFVMTDELFYERLAISVAQTGSLLPQLRGEVISNVNQLYPVLLSFVYGDANVPQSLVAAHRLNAFLMASAAIPVYLLARRIGVGRIASVWVGVLAVAVPWIVLASFLLTEVVAYPAFCWALLALTHATIRKTSVSDLIAFAAIALAVMARAQFFVLAAALPVAVIAEALLSRQPLKSLARSRPVLTGGYLLVLLVFLGAAATGEWSRLLGSYSVTANGVRVDFGLLQLVLEHVAVLALGLGLLPFLVGAAWLIDRARPSAPAPERAFAVVGGATLVLVTVQVASFNQRFGAGEVKDRYLFYVVPILLVGLAAALASRRWPRSWTYLVPSALCVLGFASVPFRTYEKLNVDSPLAMLNDELLRQATSVTWARVLLVCATLVAVQFLLMTASLLPRRALAIAVVALTSVVLPAQAVYAFERLFAVNGTNGIPITLDQGGVFNWIDRNVGKDGRVAFIPYPANGADYWAGVGYWWDVEFWNESAVEIYTDSGLHGDARWLGLFDRRTGVALNPVSSELTHVLYHETDVRFRIAGRQLVYDRGAYIYEPERPWRAAFVTDGIYPDGWTRPHTPAEIIVYADPGQKRPMRRFLTLRVESPDHRDARPVSVRSNLERWESAIAPESTLDRLVTVCVPPGGSAKIVVETPIVSAIHRDPSAAALTGETDRPAGIRLRSAALADEKERMDRCPAGDDATGVR